MKRIYLDSTIFGYAVNERAGDKYADANLLLSQIKKAVFSAHISEVVLAEINSAPVDIKFKLYEKVIPEITILEPNVAIVEIAEDLIFKNIMHKTSYNDALHLAYSIFHKIDVIASYNYKHIVNLRVELALHKYLTNKNQALIYIRNPAEVIIYD